MVRKFKNQNGTTDVIARLMDIIIQMPIDQRRHLLFDLTKAQGINSRKYNRKDYLMDVHCVANNHLYKGIINNISSKGVFIECSPDTLNRLNIDQSVTMAFEHPDKKIHIKITGKIARIEDSGFGVGFDELLQGLIEPVQQIVLSI